jgi:hypothetical protein
MSFDSSESLLAMIISSISFTASGGMISRCDPQFTTQPLHRRYPEVTSNIIELSNDSCGHQRKGHPTKNYKETLTA